jgi:hypothetical protein
VTYHNDIVVHILAVMMMMMIMVQQELLPLEQYLLVV